MWLMTVLLATDGSSYSNDACALLGRMQWGSDDTLIVMTVLPEMDVFAGPVDMLPSDPRVREEPEEDQEARAAVGKAVECLQPHFRHVESCFHGGNAAEEILIVAEKHGVDLIVAGRRGRSGLQRLFPGSVTQSLVHHAPCSVLVVREGANRLDRVLLAYDGSHEALEAAHWIESPPLPSGSTIQILTVDGKTPAVDGAPSSDDLAALYAGQGFTAKAVVTAGEPLPQILAAAEEYDVDLVALGAHAKRGWFRDMIGDTARGVVQQAKASVLVGRARPPL
jgi:nucleotide-binding universal stress UspA family protein